ncbi:MAG: hypothetical protein AAF628_13780 [Planctomycetota bacterium]
MMSRCPGAHQRRALCRCWATSAADVRRGAAAPTRRGKPAQPVVLVGLRSPMAPRRRAVARVLVALAGRDFG